MRVTYDWTEADWNEAVTLATESVRRRGNVPGMVYALVGIPLIGAVMDGARSVRGTGKLTGAGMAVPLLLVLLAAALGGGLLFARLQRRKRLRLQMPMPQGQWEAVLQEAGWRFHEKAEDVTHSTVVTGSMWLNEEASAPDAAPPANSSAAPPPADASAALETVPPAFGSTEVTSVGQAVPAEETDPKPVDSCTQLPVPASEPASASSDVAPNDEVVTPIGEPQSMTDAVHAPAGSEGTVSPKPEIPLHPWSQLTGSRTGDRVMVFLHPGGFHAVPIRCMTPDQAGHMHRMAIRKLRPAPTAR